MFRVHTKGAELWFERAAGKLGSDGVTIVFVLA